MDCGGVFVKYILFIFNILFAICGILLIVFGSIMVSQISGITSNVQQTFEANSVPIIVLILGCVIFVIAFMGCWGAIRENTCCTMSYSVIMLLLFFCQLALIIFVWTQRTKFLASVDQAVAQIWDQRKTDRQVMNALEITFNCCGKNSFTDYATSLESVPNSCCGATATSCPLTQAMTKPGCTRALTSFWEKNIDIIRYAGIGVAIVELVAFIFGYCLGMQVRNERRRANY